MADETTVKDCPDCQRLGFGAKLLDLLHEAGVKAEELTTAVRTTGAQAVEALRGIFAKLTGR